MEKTKIPYHFLFCVILLLFVAQKTYAQPEDFGLWTSIEIEKKLSKRFDIQAGFGNRLKDNLNQRDESFAGLGLAWSKKKFSAETSYRFTNENDNKSDNIAHRFLIQAGYKAEFNRLTLEYRTRLQAQYKNLNSSSSGHLPESFFRNRIKLDYNIKGIPLKPIVSYEFFYRINQYEKKKIERQRYIFGLDYKINKHNRIGLSFIVHETLNIASPVKKYILGLDYKLEI